MKKLITLLFGLLFTISAYSQNGYSSVFLRVTDSATFVNSANTTAKHAADYADIWYSVNSGLFWKWSTVTNTYTMLGSDGWATTGTTNLTGDATVDNGVNNLLIGDLAGPWSSWDIDGSGPTTIPNSRSDGIGDPAGSTHSYLRHAVNGDDSEALLSVKNATGSEESYIVVGASPAPSVSVGTTGEINLITATVQRLSIHSNGSWRLGVSEDAGTAGYVLQSNGASAAPTWVAPSGGTNTSSALTDGSTITITGPKHTLTSTQATITWTLSQTPDYQTTDIILNATSTTWTFPAGALCVVDGVASGDNTATLSGTSGDHHIMSIYKDGTNYRVAIKNFGQ